MIGVEPRVGGCAEGNPTPCQGDWVGGAGCREGGPGHLSWEGLRAWGGAGPVRVLRVLAKGPAGKVRETEAEYTDTFCSCHSRWMGVAGGSHLDEAGPGPLLTHGRSIFCHEFSHSYRHSFTSLFNEPTFAGCLLYARPCTLPWGYVTDQDACSLIIKRLHY